MVPKSHPGMTDATVRLTPGKRLLFLTKDPETVRKQLREELNLPMKARGEGLRSRVSLA